MTTTTNASSMDVALASLLTMDIAKLTQNELKEFVMTNRQLQNSPQTLRSKLENESKKLGGRKPKKTLDVSDLLGDDDED